MHVSQRVHLQVLLWTQQGLHANFASIWLHCFADGHYET
jgi:hypothetical protein